MIFSIAFSPESMSFTFDQPILFTRLFDGKTGGELMETIDAVRENAVHVTA